MNEAHSNELTNTLKAKIVKEPTPVTIFNVLKNKNKLKIHKEGKYLLLDSGSSLCLISHKLVNHTAWKRLRNPTGFESCNGDFDLTHKTEVTLTLPELNSHRTVTWQCYVDDRENDSLCYDMIISRDLMTSLGLELNFKEKKIS